MWVREKPYKPADGLVYLRKRCPMISRVMVVHLVRIREPFPRLFFFGKRVTRGMVGRHLKITNKQETTQRPLLPQSAPFFEIVKRDNGASIKSGNSRYDTNEISNWEVERHFLCLQTPHIIHTFEE